MVILKEINPKIIIAAIVISFSLIVGSIYLHLQQKTHLGRMNIGDGHKSSTVGIENIQNDEDVIYVPPLQQTTTESIVAQMDYIENTPASNEYSYVNDAKAESSEEPTGDSNSSESYYSDSVEHRYATSEEDDLGRPGLNKDCLRCLCKTVNDCKPVKCAHIDPCGIYGISKYYWIDGGKQTTLENQNDYSEEDSEFRDYLRCINNEKCATATVSKYMKRYERDCNNDGIINCEDYITLHLLGPTGCRSKQMSGIHRMRMNSCLK